MTGVEKLTGATLSLGNRWDAINWRNAGKEVKRLQMRIAKAVKNGERNKVKSLQWILTHALSAKFLAVKRVTSRKGAKTPGVDGVVWNTSAKKMRGALSLQRNGYKASPLRRILIPKRNGKMRPLGIPTMKDRAMQALYLLALEPVAETLADTNSYGFRPYRACRDAIGQCFCALGKKCSPKWVLEADIKACFDWISHDWLLENIPSDRKMLAEWLRCGFMQERKLFPTRDGTPQGGVISPTLANMTLDGLENAIRKVSHRKRDMVNFIRYADDFVVTASSKEHLEQVVLPAIGAFLKERGLTVSPEKTRVVHIEQGFDFLGQNIRKYRNKLIMEPSKDSTTSFKQKVKSIIRNARGWNAGSLIEKLNPVVRGWTIYHRCIQSAKIFGKMHEILYRSLRNWAKHNNSGKTSKWIRNRFFGLSAKGRFSCMSTDYRGKRKLLELISPRDIRLVRYIKIKRESNPFNPDWLDYFRMRRVAKNCTPC
jgi:RNA-directed DNA polymerase